MSVLLVVIAVLQAAAGAVVLARLARGKDRPDPLAPGAPAAPGCVSIVVPARDEAARIDPLLDALRRTGPAVREIIVVDDRSTDATAARVEAAAAADPRVRLVHGVELADGWVGKQHALQQGLAVATGAWTLCLDADARPDPALPDALVACVERHGYDVITAGPRFAVDTLGETILHPSLLATLVYRFGPPTPAAATSDRIVANGQCLLVPTARFRDAGGWTPVRANMTEDVALARHLVRSGWRVGMADGARLLTVDMHASGREAWREWGRSLALPGVASAAEQARGIALLVLTLALPPWVIAAVLLTGAPLLALVPSAVLLAVRLAFHAALRPTYAGAGGAYWLAPLADGLAVIRLIASALRPNRRWRGRTYATSA